MAENSNNLMQFSSADGGLVVNAENLKMEELISIVLTASKSGRRTILTNFTAIEREILKRIANTGKGNILFDLR